MSEENINQEFRPAVLVETKNYLIEEVKAKSRRIDE